MRQLAGRRSTVPDDWRERGREIHWLVTTESFDLVISHVRGERGEMEIEADWRERKGWQFFFLAESNILHKHVKTTLTLT